MDAEQAQRGHPESGCFRAARALHRVTGDFEVTAGDWGRVVWKQMDVTSIWSLDPSRVKRSI